MKKKAKILTTVASLCLAVALMAFGVYAMTQATLNVKTNITFTVKDVFAYVTLDGYVSSDGTSANADGTQTLEQATRKTYTGTTADSPGEADSLTAWDLHATPFNLDSTNKVATWIVTIYNRSTTNSIYVRVLDNMVTDVPGVAESATYTLYANGVVSGTANTVVTPAASGASLVAAGSLTDSTTGIIKIAPTTNLTPSTADGADDQIPAAASYVQIVFTYTITDFSKKITSTAALNGDIYLDNVPNAQA